MWGSRGRMTVAVTLTWWLRINSSTGAITWTSLIAFGMSCWVSKLLGFILLFYRYLIVYHGHLDPHHSPFAINYNLQAHHKLPARKLPLYFLQFIKSDKKGQSKGSGKPLLCIFFYKKTRHRRGKRIISPWTLKIVLWMCMDVVRLRVKGN